MTRVAILSDTHGLLRNEVLEEVKKADAIIHAGDINTEEIVQTLRDIAPLYIVRGNNDKEWAEDLPVSQTITIDGVSLFIIHNIKELPKDLPKVDIIVYGHSHKYSCETKEGICYLNPGSCGKRRFNLEIALCRMEIDQGSYKIEKITYNQ